MPFFRSMMLLTLAAAMAVPADAGRIFGNRSTRRQPSRSSRPVQRTPQQTQQQRPQQTPTPAPQQAVQQAPSAVPTQTPPGVPPAATTPQPVRKYRSITQAEVQRLTDQLLKLSAGQRAASPFDTPTFRSRVASSMPAYPRQIEGWVKPEVAKRQNELLKLLQRETNKYDFTLLRSTIADDGQSATICMYIPELKTPLYREYDVQMTPRGYRVVDVFQSDADCLASESAAIFVASQVATDYGDRSRLVPQSFRDWRDTFVAFIELVEEPPQSFDDLIAAADSLPAGTRNHPWISGLLTEVVLKMRSADVNPQEVAQWLIDRNPDCYAGHTLYYLMTPDYEPTPQYYASVQLQLDRFGPDARLLGAMGSAYFADGDRQTAQTYYDEALTQVSQRSETYSRVIRDELALGTTEAAQRWVDLANALTDEDWSLDEFDVDRYFLDQDRMDQLAMQLSGIIIDPDLLASDDSPLDPIGYANRIYAAGGLDEPKLAELAMPMLLEEVGSLAETLIPSIAAIKEGGSYDFQQAVIDEDRTGGRLIFRYEDGDGYDSYDQWIVARTSDRSFRIVDVIEMQVGLPKSDFGAMNVVDGLVDSPLAQNHLTPEIREFHQTSRAILRIKVLNSDERYEKALSVWKALPDRYRLASDSLSEAMVAQQNLNDWSSEEGALWMLSQNPDCEYAWHLLYLSMADEDATPMMADALRKLNERLPGDPSLLASLAIANMATGGDLDESMGHIEAALERRPTNQGVYLAAVKLQARYGTPADTLAWLKRADDAVTISWQALPDWPEMTDFLKTDEYALWLDHLGGGPTYDRRQRMAKRPEVAL